MNLKIAPFMQKAEQHKGTGHRGRLRERFLQGGLSSFLDYEIVELLLTLGTPRRDCKAMAKEAIKKFKGLRGVLDASSDELQEIKGIGPSNAFGLKLFQAMAERYAKESMPGKVTLDSAEAIFNYLQKSIGRETKEHFMLLCLDSRHNLINISEISVGTINASIVHPREVFQTAIKSLATQIILAHNHPSGDPEPSTQDVAITARLCEASRILGIELLDHVVVTSDKFVSLKDRRLLS